MPPDLPPGMGDSFPGFLGDLLRLLRSDAPFPFELAQQLAEGIAQEGGDTSVEPIERIRLEEFARLAELQVADVTGMSVAPAGKRLELVALSRLDWARQNLLEWRPIFESLAAELRARAGQAVLEESMGDEEDRQLGAMLSQWSDAIAPAMIAMQLGSLVGHLAGRTLGQYELLLPRGDGATITVVPENLAAFASDWSLARDDVLFYFAVRDVAIHATLGRPHVRTRLLELMVERARGFRPDPHALESAVGDAGMTDAPELAALSRILGTPAAFGAMADTPEQRRVEHELQSLCAAIGGYAEWVTTIVAERSIGATGPISEARRRRRVDQREEDRTVEGLLGLGLDQQAIERGEAFVRGVLERGAERELAQLFVVDRNLPTPAEVDAPGLWIERIHLEDLHDDSTGDADPT